MSHPWLALGAALVAGGVAALSWTVRRTWPRLALGIADVLADSRDTGGFDTHATTAMALLTPDALDDMPTPLADQVESWLRAQPIREN